MRRAIDETDRRRARQVEHNRLHGIEPRGVQKQVREMIDGVYDAQSAKTELKAAQEKARYGAMDEKHVAREIKRLEKAMLDHARNFEFEEAARARDQLAQLRTAGLRRERRRSSGRARRRRQDGESGCLTAEPDREAMVRGSRSSIGQD